MNILKPAFAILTGISEFQNRGIWDFQRAKKQVEAPNFGPNTLTAFDNLMSREAITNKKAFSILLTNGNPNFYVFLFPFPCVKIINHSYGYA